ncbi:hypothetical protein [Bradyrhizobium agreste]|nr:hypothetical protein [Bradyrhizobium agreste]
MILRGIGLLVMLSGFWMMTQNTRTRFGPALVVGGVILMVVD